MQKPSAPPLEVLTVYPINSNYEYNKNYSNNYEYNNNNSNNYEYSNNFQNNQHNRNLMPFQNSQIVIIEKKNNNDNLAKVGCAAALLTFCCMQ